MTFVVVAFWLRMLLGLIKEYLKHNPLPDKCRAEPTMQIARHDDVTPLDNASSSFAFYEQDGICSCCLASDKLCFSIITFLTVECRAHWDDVARFFDLDYVQLLAMLHKLNAHYLPPASRDNNNYNYYFHQYHCNNYYIIIVRRCKILMLFCIRPLTFCQFPLTPNK